MRLVSEALYNKVMNADPTPTEKLIAEKDEILQSKTIPEDIKPQLYHQAVRQIATLMKTDEENPIPMSITQKSTTTPEEKQRRMLLEAFFDSIQVEKDKKGKLVTGGKSHVTSYEKAVNRMLGKDTDNKILGGIKFITDAMDTAGLPEQFFYAGQRGSGLRTKKGGHSKPHQRRKKIVAKMNAKKNIKWKSY